MKKGRAPRIFVLAFMGAMMLFSCRKEYSFEGEAVITGDFRANIDGVEWIASDGAKNVTILGGIISITGIDPNNKGLNITIVDTAVGLYTLSQTSASLGAYGDIDSTGAYTFTTNQGQNANQAGGIVNITDVDYIHNTISGTFSFNVFRNIDGVQHVITNGVFYKLPFTNTQPPPNTADTLQATIDGSNWKASSVNGTILSNQLIISGTLTNGNQSVGLIMPSTITAGSYTLDFTGRTYIGLYNPTPNVALASSAGTLTILSNDVRNKRIRGNFTFQVVDPLGGPTPTHNLTNGFFSVGYQ